MSARRSMYCLALVAACGDKGYGLDVNLEPACIDAATQLVVTVTLQPPESGPKQQTIADAKGFFAHGHHLVIVPRAGTTRVTVRVQAATAAGLTIADASTSVNVDGPALASATLKLGLCGPDLACPAKASTLCGSACVNLKTDPEHCGDCGTQCAAGALCTAGLCAMSCDPLTLCNSMCVDTSMDPAHCGDCSTVCKGGAHAAPACNNSFCALSCDPGWDNCDGSDANGCEAHTDVDVANCGACKASCTLSHATPACAAGQCAIKMCEAHFADCDKDATNGCEAALLSDGKNCGTCGTVCPGGGSCVSGACKPLIVWRPLAGGTTVDLAGAWGSSFADVYLVGSKGTILHSTDGATFAAQASSTPYDLTSVWGSSATDLYAVGYSGTILHRSGTAWSPQTSTTTGGLYSVWGGSPSSVWAVGFQSVLLGGSGSWAMQSTGTNVHYVFSVWGSSSGVVHFGGDGGAMLRYAGGQWSAQRISLNVYSIWGSGPGDIYAVGGVGIYHSSDDGLSWQPQSSGVTVDLQGVWGSGPGDVFAVGATGVILHSSGDGTWTPMTSGTTKGLLGIWGTGPNNVYVVGQAGTILRGQ